MSNRILRTGVFVSAGAFGIARGAIGSWQPAYWAPVTTLDWIAVWVFSAFLIAVAAALLLLAREQRRLGRWVFGCGATGAALAGVANALEDGIGIHRLGYPFAAGIALTIAALLFGGLWLITRQPGRRWPGVLCVADVAVLALAFDTIGLIAFGSTLVFLGCAGYHQRASSATKGSLPKRPTEGGLIKLRVDVDVGCGERLQGHGGID